MQWLEWRNIRSTQNEFPILKKHQQPEATFGNHGKPVSPGLDLAVCSADSLRKGLRDWKIFSGISLLKSKQWSHEGPTFSILFLTFCMEKIFNKHGLFGDPFQINNAHHEHTSHHHAVLALRCLSAISLRHCCTIHTLGQQDMETCSTSVYFDNLWYDCIGLTYSLGYRLWWKLEIS